MDETPKQPVALVTGASSGIGEASAEALAQAGFTVVLAARREDPLRALAERIEQAGGRALVVRTDLSDDDATSTLVRTTLDAFGRVDVLVNNAGYGPPFALEQMNRTQLRHVFDVNLLCGMQLISELTPTMRAQGGGRVINMGSMARYVAAPMAVSYAATKAAMEAMNDCLRLELSPWNIQLSVIVPGFVDTPTFEKSRAAAQDLRDDPANPYGALMRSMDAFAETQLKRAISAEAVGAVVVEAAMAKRPAARYFVPKAGRAIARSVGSLPRRWAEKLLLKTYKWGPGHG